VVKLDDDHSNHYGTAAVAAAQPRNKTVESSFNVTYLRSPGNQGIQ